MSTTPHVVRQPLIIEHQRLSQVRAASACRLIVVLIASLTGMRPIRPAWIKGQAVNCSSMKSLCQEVARRYRYRAIEQLKYSVHSELDRAMHTETSTISHKSSHHVHSYVHAEARRTDPSTSLRQIIAIWKDLNARDAFDTIFHSHQKTKCAGTKNEEST